MEDIGVAGDLFWRKCFHDRHPDLEAPHPEN